jgi:hypothetical protein
MERLRRQLLRIVGTSGAVLVLALVLCILHRFAGGRSMKPASNCSGRNSL